MRIAFVYDVPYPWHIGGIEFTNYTEAKELSRHHKVDFFTLRWPEMKEEFTYTGIRYHTFHDVTQKQVYRHGRRSIREALMFSLGLYRLFRYEYDVLVVNQFPVLHLPLIKLYCMIKKSKLIIEVAEVWDKKYWTEYLGWFLGSLAMAISTRLIKNADMYIVNSSATGRKLGELGVDKNLIVSFAPAIEESLIRKVNRKKVQKSKTVLFSGRLIKEKRLDKWIEIVGKAHKKDPKIKGVIIGSGPEYDSTKKAIEKNGLKGVIEMRPFYKEKEKFYDELHKSGLVLHMSEREGLGIVAIESIALGTPLLVPENSPFPKEIKEMCMVGREKDMPRKIVEILNSGSKGRYIKSTRNIESFLISNTTYIFNKIFRSMGLKSLNIKE